jgi:hypothetical protein
VQHAFGEHQVIAADVVWIARHVVAFDDFARAREYATGDNRAADDGART